MKEVYYMVKAKFSAALNRRQKSDSRPIKVITVS